ncbi:unnamed protein product [Discosporangium mesarthrocarpum]
MIAFSKPRTDLLSFALGHYAAKRLGGTASHISAVRELVMWITTANRSNHPRDSIGLRTMATPPPFQGLQSSVVTNVAIGTGKRPRRWVRMMSATQVLVLDVDIVLFALNFSGLNGLFAYIPFLHFRS